MYVDNKSAIDIAYNPKHHTKMKHVERRLIFVRELVEDMMIRVPFVATADNLADFFTKLLDKNTFCPLRNKIMNITHSPKALLATGG